ncbi:hypothetical protein ACJJTC_004223 [Scirpophaga incertulas]
MHINKLDIGEEPMDVDAGPSNLVDDENGVNNAGANDDVDHLSEDEEGGIRIGDIYIPPAPTPALTFEANGPRLVITHIVNKNFKSYAGVQVLGPFHKSFTAIIGPNGSGKSNVIDSMLFVFGYRATKIRSKKISVLIHSSSKHPDVTSATVAVHFCRIIDGVGEAYTVVPDSEIVVSRSAFKDNSSFYTLNNRRVQFKEVARMLRSNGIDLDHNRFLILQGEVEQIALMKPKATTEHEYGMLEYLEDIVGTSRYKEPLNKLTVRVDELSEQRKEKLNRVRMVEQEKQILERPMKEAVELVNLTNNMLRTRNVLLNKYIHETNKLVQAKEAEMVEFKETLAQLDQEMNNIKEELNEKNNVLKTGMQKYEKLEKKKEEVAEKLHVSKKRTIDTNADLGVNNKKKKNLEQLLEQEKGKLVELELIPDKNKREIEECEKLLAKHNENKIQAMEEFDSVMESVRTKTKHLQDEKDRLQAQLMDLTTIVTDASRKFKLAQSELKLYLSTQTNASDKLKALQESYQKAIQTIEEKESLRKELSSSVPTNERQIRELHTKLNNLKVEETSVVVELRSVRVQLEESKQAMSANKSRGKVLDSLMAEKRNGNLPGIFGRLGDLGGLDNKYDVAISTCCGPLDNIVVDTVETAQACVEHLKKYNIGRATFIALDKQTHLIPRMQSKNTYPENVPRLFDLIVVKDERVLPAFYFALTDTLVANDLEQASRIAYGRNRYRVVTLKGDVIEIAGTMTGGGKTTLRGRMGRSVQQDTSEQDPRALQAKEAQFAALEQQLAEIRAEQLTVEETLATLEMNTRNDINTLASIDMELKALKGQLPELKSQIKRQESVAASCKVDLEQKCKLETLLAESEETLNNAKRDAGEVEKEVHGVDAKIAAIAGNQVKDLQKKRDELDKKINKVQSESTKLAVAINTSIRNAKKSKDKITQMEADLAETERNIQKLNNKKKELTLESTKLEKDLEELEEQIQEGSQEFGGLKKEIESLQVKDKKIVADRWDANNAVQKIEKTIHDYKARFPTWQRELSSLTLEDPGIDGVPGVERPAPLETPSPEVLEAVTVEELKNRYAAQKARVGDAVPDLQAIQEYKAKEDLYLTRAAELDEITSKRNEMRDLLNDLKKTRATEFSRGFITITTKLKEMYQMITMGGDAELEFIDSLDAFTEGITFSVRPPNKSWKNISNLSGGEKTLSSLALVFALHYYKPTPLYVMDEIDAALDFKNVSIVANYIKDRTRNAQFIIISLRYNMFEVSNRLVGIYKTQDCTKSVTLENKRPAANNENARDREASS